MQALAADQVTLSLSSSYKKRMCKEIQKIKLNTGETTSCVMFVPAVRIVLFLGPNPGRARSGGGFRVSLNGIRTRLGARSFSEQDSFSGRSIQYRRNGGMERLGGFGFNTPTLQTYQFDSSWDEKKRIARQIELRDSHFKNTSTIPVDVAVFVQPRDGGPAIRVSRIARVRPYGEGAVFYDFRRVSVLDTFYLVWSSSYGKFRPPTTNEFDEQPGSCWREIMDLNNYPQKAKLSGFLGYGSKQIDITALNNNPNYFSTCYKPQQQLSLAGELHRTQQQIAPLGTNSTVTLAPQRPPPVPSRANKPMLNPQPRPQTILPPMRFSLGINKTRPLPAPPIQPSPKAPNAPPNAPVAPNAPMPPNAPGAAPSGLPVQQRRVTKLGPAPTSRNENNRPPVNMGPAPTDENRGSLLAQIRNGRRLKSAQARQQPVLKSGPPAEEDCDKIPEPLARSRCKNQKNFQDINNKFEARRQAIAGDSDEEWNSDED